MKSKGSSKTTSVPSFYGFLTRYRNPAKPDVYSNAYQFKSLKGNGITEFRFILSDGTEVIKRASDL